MTIGLYSSIISTEVLSAERSAKADYRTYPDLNRYWCMIDLVQSSNYRLSVGPEQAYIRGRSFFELIKSTCKYSGEVRQFKEMGDAALLVSSEFRPMLECCLLIIAACNNLRNVAATEIFPFAVRLGLDFGTGKKIPTSHEDYLSSSIDRLARIMTVRSTRTNMLIGDKVYQQDLPILNEYKDILKLSDPILLPLPDNKFISEPIWYRELVVDSEAAAKFNDYFVDWRSALTQAK